MNKRFCILYFIEIYNSIGENINHFVRQIEEDQGVRVFMIDNATDEQIQTLKQQLLSIPGISSADFISQADAYKEMKEEYEKYEDGDKVMQGYQESIFPVAYKVKFKDLGKAEEIEEQIKKLDNVDTVAMEDDMMQKLNLFARGTRIVTYVIAILLVIFAIFIITNTIKLTVYARRKEISIMKYVGATNGFIRWPFAVEGMIIGIISGLIATGILSLVYNMFIQSEGFKNFLKGISQVLTVLNFTDMLELIILVYMVLGILIGALGSTISMRKYLKV